jgi:SanA protein
LANDAGLVMPQREQAAMFRFPKRLLTPTQRRRQQIFWAAGLIVVFGMVLMYADVQRERRLICVSVADASVRPVAIVFGAAGAILEDRVTTGVELYKAGKVRKLLMTGDNSRNNYNEPAAMRQQALAQGVPPQDIVCDYAGFRTYDSLYRAHAIFGITSALLVTQRYHLPRALFIARRLGMNVVGVDAAKRRYAGQWSFDLREIAAVEVAWVQATITHPRPKFLGKPEPL